MVEYLRHLDHRSSWGTKALSSFGMDEGADVRHTLFWIETVSGVGYRVRAD